MVNQGTWKDMLWPDNWTAVKYYIYLIKIHGCFINLFRLLKMDKDQLNLNILWLSRKEELRFSLKDYLNPLLFIGKFKNNRK